MNAGLIAVGTELLRLGRQDGNSEWLTDQLRRQGVDVRLRIAVEDDPHAIAAAIRTLVDECDLVLLTGGLGPTEDDRTREALSRAADLPLERDDAQIETLRARFARFGRVFGEVQLKQADRPRGAEWIDNPLGSAPGLWLRWRESHVVALPGVPAEMKAMFTESLVPWIVERAHGLFATRTLRVAGRMESSVDEQLRDLYAGEGVSVTILTGAEGIELHLRASGETLDEARRRLDDLDAACSARLGDDLYGRDDETLPLVVGLLLRRRGETVATSESCTAGMLGGTITRVAGSSGWYRGGVVVYSNEMKEVLAGISREVIEAHGAVSEAVARDLAESVRRNCRAEYGVAITGIAGPGGGTEAKPVGTVHVAIADSERTDHRSMRMIGDRTLIRRRTVTAVLDLLRRRLLARAARD